MYAYTLFGLTIHSSLQLPELALASPDTPADVVVRTGMIPPTIEDVLATGVLYQISARQMRMSIDNIVSFLVSDGQEIIVEPHKSADDASVRLFLLGSALGALLHQRGMLPLHASCIETEYGAVLFVGRSGVGKSTTAAAFHKLGYPILADDITVIQAGEDGVPTVLPGYPQIKLWAESLEKLEQGTTGLEKVRPQIEKYAVPIRDGFSSKPLAVHAVYILMSNLSPDFSLKPVTGMQKIMILRRHTYRSTFLGEMGKVNPNLLAFAQKVRICLVKRPEIGYQLDELVEAVKADFSA